MGVGVAIHMYVRTGESLHGRGYFLANLLTLHGRGYFLAREATQWQRNDNLELS